MKSPIVALLMIVFALCNISAAFAENEIANSAVRDGWIKHETQLSYKALNAGLNKAIKANKMLRVTQASASAGAKGRGLSIPGNRVVGVYRNDFAIRMLEASIDAGIEAPIRFYVTEGPDGKATLSYKTPTHVFSPYFEEGGEPLVELAAELDVIFAKIAMDAISQ